jgi:hypothetical protein
MTSIDVRTKTEAAPGVESVDIFSAYTCPNSCASVGSTLVKKGKSWSRSNTELR